MASIVTGRMPIVMALVYVCVSLVNSEDKIKIVSHYSIVTTNRVQQSSTHDISSNGVKKATLRPVLKHSSARSLKTTPAINPEEPTFRSINTELHPAVIKLNMTSFMRIFDEVPISKERPESYSRSLISGTSEDRRLLASLKSSHRNGDFPKESNSSIFKSFQYLKEFNASSYQNSQKTTNSSYLCSEFYDGEEFYIRSPNYPFNYPPFTSCRYTIRGSPDKNICGVRLTALQFDLPISPHGKNMSFKSFHNQTKHFCYGDRLVVDGHVLCGRFRRGTEGLYRFSTSVLSIEFQSGNGFGASGFLLKGKQTKNCSTAEPFPNPQESSVNCNRIIFRRTFTISSPGYPLQYPHEADCSYIIVRKNSNVCGLKIILKDFDLEETNYCMFDYIEIQGKRYCGRRRDNEPLYFMFEDEELSIRFKTDELVSGPGFKILGQQILCDDLRYFRPIDSPLITNRNINRQDENDEYSWNLHDIGYAISHFAPLNSIDNNSRQAKTLITNEMRTNLNEKRLIKGDDLEKRDLSERNLPQDNINLHPFTDDNPISVNINESIFPESMRNKINEIFPLFNISFNEGNNSSGSKLENSSTEGERPLSEMDADLDTFKNFDRIPVNGFDSLPPIGVKFDGPIIIPNVVELDNRNISLATCDEHHFSQVFLLQSPNYPNFYPHNVNCIYYVNRFSQDVCQLRITIEDLHIAKSFNDAGSCHSDYLDIAGYRLCGDIEKKSVDMAFTNNIVALQFHSDSQLRSRGFLITVEQVTQDCKKKLARSDPANCNATVSKSEFTLVSPGFPKPYFFNLWCVTTLLKENIEITSLQIDFVYFDVEPSTDCRKDYFLIGRRRYCGNLTGNSYVVPFPSDKIKFSFASNEIYSSGGFRIKIKQILNLAEDRSNCGGIVHSSSNLTILTSPFYPQGYLPSLHCTYVITRKSSDICHLQAKILVFDVEASMGCRNDFLQFGAYDRICGMRRRNELRNYHFTSEKFKIVFHTDSYINGNGYRIELHQYPCQGLGTGNNFWRTDQPPTITSPSYQLPGPGILKPFIEIHCPSNPAKSLLEFLQGNQDNIPLTRSQTLFGMTTAFPLLESHNGYLGSTDQQEVRASAAQVLKDYIASKLRPIQFPIPNYRTTENLAINARNCVYCKSYSHNSDEVIFGSPSQVSSTTLEITSPRAFLAKAETDPSLGENGHNHLKVDSIPWNYDNPKFPDPTHNLQSDITFNPGTFPDDETLRPEKEIYSKWHSPIYKSHSEIPINFKIKSLLHPSSQFEFSENSDFNASAHSSKYQLSLNPLENSQSHQSYIQINKDLNFTSYISPSEISVNTSFHSHLLPVPENLRFRKAFPPLRPKIVSNSQPQSPQFDKHIILISNTSHRLHSLIPNHYKFSNKTYSEAPINVTNLSTVTPRTQNTFDSKLFSSIIDQNFVIPTNLTLNYSKEGSFTKIPIKSGINFTSVNSETRFEKRVNSSSHKPPSFTGLNNSVPTPIFESLKKLGFNVSTFTTHSGLKNKSELHPMTPARPIKIFRNSGFNIITTTARSKAENPTKLDSKIEMNASDSEFSSSNVNAVHHNLNKIRTISDETFGNKMGLPIFADSLKFCNESIEFQHFEMTNPGYPSTYAVDLHCLYSVKRFSEHHCALAFQLRELNIPSEKNCRTAFLSVAGRRLCGTQINPISVIIPFSPGTPIFIEYQSDKLVTGSKFSLAMQQIPCVGSPHVTHNVSPQQSKLGQPTKFIQPPKIAQPPKYIQPPKIAQPLMSTKKTKVLQPPNPVQSQKKTQQLPIRASSSPTITNLDPQKLYQHSRDVLSVIKSPPVKHLEAPPKRNKITSQNGPINLAKPQMSWKPTGGRGRGSLSFSWPGFNQGMKLPFKQSQDHIQRQKGYQNQYKKVKYTYVI